MTCGFVPSRVPSLLCCCACSLATVGTEPCRAVCPFAGVIHVDKQAKHSLFMRSCGPPPPVSLCDRFDLMFTVSVEGHVGYAAISCTQLLCVKYPLLPVVCDQQGATLEGAGQLNNKRTKHARDLQQRGRVGRRDHSGTLPHTGWTYAPCGVLVGVLVPAHHSDGMVNRHKAAMS
jgi:hypothetical protein